MTPTRTDTWLCATCAVEIDGEPAEGAICPICADERQYVPRGGQRWTSVPELIDAGHTLQIDEVEPGLLGLHADPRVGIGQRSLLATTEHGNLLWDPTGLITDEAVERVRAAGPVLAVAASHPHMFGVQVDWARALDAPVLVNEADAEWVQRHDPVIEHWSGRRELAPGLELLQLGGHFRGSAVALWAPGAGGKGSLLAGDTIGVNPDGSATFMRSFPNRLPLSAAVVRRLADATDRLQFDRLYANFGVPIDTDARAVVRRSADRYAAWVSGEYDHLT